MARERTGLRVLLLVTLLAAFLLPATRNARGQTPDRSRVALAYVLDGMVTLADGDGQPLSTPGPTFSYGKGARLIWTPDGETLYIARDDGIYASGTGGGAAVRVAGGFGRTLAFAQDAGTVYYLETSTPQETDLEGRIAFPFREIDVRSMGGGTGRLAGYFGQFAADAVRANLSFAAALYVREGGLLGVGRPELFPTYGSNVFGSCCFPDPGLGMFNVHTGEFELFDVDFIPGAAALNLTRTHLAGPVTNGTIRVYDLITGGQRDYIIEIAGGLGVIERMAWSPDDTYLYFAVRYDPTTPLIQTESAPFEVDTRGADVYVFRLNLVTSVIRRLAWRSNVYGVSSLAATDTYVFATVINRPDALVQAINNRQVRFDAQPTDDDIQQKYMPLSLLWRIDATGTIEPSDVMANVWGVAARPIR